MILDVFFLHRFFFGVNLFHIVYLTAKKDHIRNKRTRPTLLLFKKVKKKQISSHFVFYLATILSYHCHSKYMLILSYFYFPISLFGRIAWADSSRVSKTVLNITFSIFYWTDLRPFDSKWIICVYLAFR